MSSNSTNTENFNYTEPKTREGLSYLLHSYLDLKESSTEDVLNDIISTARKSLASALVSFSRDTNCELVAEGGGISR